MLLKRNSNFKMPALNEIPTQGARLTCKNCSNITEVPAIIRMHLEDNKRAMLSPFQCFECGKITVLNQLSDEAINAICECGGRLHRDKQLFCCACQYNKIQD